MNRKRLLRYAAALVVLLIVIAAFAAGLFPISRLLEVSQPPEKADIILVPSGDDAPRLAKTAELFHEGYAPRIIMTGFYHAQDQGTRFCRQYGIRKSAVIIEPAASSTYENATLSAPLLRKCGARTVILVTSSYHSRRALQTFRHVMPDVRFISVPTRRAGWPVTPKTLNLEFAKLCYYSISHRMWP